MIQLHLLFLNQPQSISHSVSLGDHARGRRESRKGAAHESDHACLSFSWDLTFSLVCIIPTDANKRSSSLSMMPPEYNNYKVDLLSSLSLSLSFL